MLDIVGATTAALEVGLLVYNAGPIFGSGAFLDTVLDDLLRTVRLNAIGQIAPAHHFGQGTAERGQCGSPWRATPGPLRW